MMWKIAGNALIWKKPELEYHQNMNESQYVAVQPKVAQRETGD